MTIIQNENVSNNGIFLFIGQAGCQNGSNLWKLFNIEHSIQPDGAGLPSGTYKDQHVCFYKDTNIYLEDEFHRNFCYYEIERTEKFVPRTLFIDLEPAVIDEIKTGSYRQLFSEDKSFHQYCKFGDGAAIFSRAYNTIGRCTINSVMNIFRQNVEMSERLNVVNIARSYGGATGSGLGSLILECLHDQYSKILLTETNILNFGGGNSPTTEPYNSLLGLESSCSSGSITVLFSNNALKRICCNQLRIQMPLFYHMNKLLCYGLSGIYSSERFPGYGCCNINSIFTNLVPFPRIQFAVCSMTPLVSKKVINYEPCHKPKDMIKCILSGNNTLFDIDLNTSPFISNCMIYRGIVSPFQISFGQNMMMKNKIMKLVEWSPLGVKTGHSPLSIIEVPDFDLGVSPLSMTMLSNHTNISDSIARVCLDVNILLKKKAFLHWFIENGMEEDDFKSALENALLLSLDYKHLGDPDKDAKTVEDKEIEIENLDLLQSAPTRTDIKNNDIDNISLLQKSLQEGSNDNITETLKSVLATMTAEDLDLLAAIAKSKGLDADFLKSFGEGHMIDANLNMIETLTTLLDAKNKAINNDVTLQDNLTETINNMSEDEKESLIALAKSMGIDNVELLAAIQNGQVNDDNIKTISMLLDLKEKEMTKSNLTETFNNMTEDEKEELISFAKSMGIDNVELLAAIQNGQVDDDNIKTISMLLDLKEKEMTKSNLTDIFNDMTDEEKENLIKLAKSQGISDMELLNCIQKGEVTEENIKVLSKLLELMDKSTQSLTVNSDKFLELGADKVLIKPENSDLYKSVPGDDSKQYETAVEIIETSTTMNTVKIYVYNVRCALSTSRSYEESYASCIHPKTSLLRINEFNKRHAMLNPDFQKSRCKDKGIQK